MEEKATVTKQETLQALRNPGEIYVVMSAATKMPFVDCDDETFDDQVFLYYRLEDAKEKAKGLAEQQYQTGVAKVEEKQLLGFYTSLYTMGVNCLAVNHGTDMAVSVQLSELVRRRNPDELPKGQKLVENPALHLTAMYFIQELRRTGGAEITQEIKDLQEELLAHYQKGTFILAIQEDGQVPVLKQKDGTVYQPVFTDALEYRKFVRDKKMRTAVVPAAKIPEVLVPDAKGVAINPFGVNVQLQVTRPKKTASAPGVPPQEPTA